MLLAACSMVASQYAILAWCPAQSERGSRWCSTNTMSARRRKFESVGQVVVQIVRFEAANRKSSSCSPHSCLPLFSLDRVTSAWLLCLSPLSPLPSNPSQAISSRPPWETILGSFAFVCAKSRSSTSSRCWTRLSAQPRAAGARQRWTAAH